MSDLTISKEGFIDLAVKYWEAVDKRDKRIATLEAGFSTLIKHCLQDGGPRITNAMVEEAYDVLGNKKGDQQ
jgi:hypothetical protein